MVFDFIPKDASEFYILYATAILDQALIDKNRYLNEDVIFRVLALYDEASIHSTPTSYSNNISNLLRIQILPCDQIKGYINGLPLGRHPGFSKSIRRFYNDDIIDHGILDCRITKSMFLNRLKLHLEDNDKYSGSNVRSRFHWNLEQLADIDDREITDAEKKPCGSGYGFDNRSSTFDWSDNCAIMVHGNKPEREFSNSGFTVGVQRILICLGYFDIPSIKDTPVEKTFQVYADGIFGRLTEAAIHNYQTAHGIISDGIVGAHVWSSLQAELSLMSNKRAYIADNDGEFDLYTIPSKLCRDIPLFLRNITDEKTENNNSEWMLYPLSGSDFRDFSINLYRR